VEPSGAPWRVIDSTDPQPAPTAVAAAPRGIPMAAIGVALIAIVVAGAAVLLAMRDAPVIGVDGAADLVAGAYGRSDAGRPASAPPTEEVVVDVGGAVVQPGVYRLPPGSRVADAIAAAGGFGARVDAALADTQLNLAAPVRDGEQVHVPVRGEAGTSAPGAAAQGGRAGGGAALVDLNAASAEALDSLPGVGPATAAKIIAAREEQPFATVDDLLARKVVGAATLEKLRALVSVGP
jgi:competence protein ComEA